MIQKILLSFLFLFTLKSNAADLKLALNWKPEPQFGGFYQALWNKHFDKTNNRISILEGGSGTPTIQMLAAGKIDYAIVAGDEIVIAHDRGAKDIVGVFAVYQTNPQGIMTHAERGFKTIDDVFNSEGTLLWQGGLPYAQYLQKKYPKMKVKTAPYLGGITNFQNDKNLSQQCFVTSEPITADKAGVMNKSFLIADTGFNPYVTVVAVKKSHLEKNPEQVRAIVEAIRNGWTDYLKDPATTNEKMQKMNPSMDIDSFTKSAKSQAPLIKPTGRQALGVMTEERWDQLIQQMKSLKLIKKDLKASQMFQNF